MFRRPLASSMLFVALVVPSIASTQGVGNAPAPLADPVRAELAALARDPALAGTAIYTGHVTPIGAKDSTLRYRYERRVRGTGAAWVSSHVTFDPSGTVVVLQRARHDAGYGLAQAEMVQAQNASVSAVKVTGGQAVFTLERDGRTRTRTERVREPLVAGPTIFGWIVAHWDELAQGRTLPIRFAVLERSESIAFRLERVASAPGRTVVRMAATDPVLRWFVAPTSFEFETATRHILGYVGRVPTLERTSRGWRPMDARVRYTFTAAAFR